MAIDGDRIDRVRWNWLMQTYNYLNDDLRDEVIKRFGNGSHSLGHCGRRDDEILYGVMLDLGVVINGVDPHPPPKAPLPTDEGAEEYQDIMAAQELLR